MTPTVINRHHYHGKSLPRPWLYVGRRTPLGNPFTLEQHGEMALVLYRRWLWEKIQRRDKPVLEVLLAIEPGDHLVCSCAPRPCHADIIAAAWAWLREQPLCAWCGHAEIVCGVVEPCVGTTQPAGEPGSFPGPGRPDDLR